MALLKIASEIVAIDLSAEMLSQAARHSKIHYVQARAEQMPFDRTSFGILTVGLAFHWFNREAFMAEAQRVLPPGGWLVVYDDAFCGQMIGNQTYEAWFRGRYLAQYPTPPRNNKALTDSDALTYGFTSPCHDHFSHEIEFTAEQLVNYMLTQTNVIAAVEAGNEDLGSVSHWLSDSVGPMFSKTFEHFSFLCKMQFFKRT